jgi:hypothetical protein
LGQARGRIAATASSAALAGHSGLACIRINAAAVERDTPAAVVLRQFSEPVSRLAVKLGCGLFCVAHA